ncbi:MAG: lipopolysaccharide biosynthesis protein, partial [Pedobacter sp.]
MATESQNVNEAEVDEISLKLLILKIVRAFKYLLSKWIVILIFGLIGGALGFLYALNKKPVYIATTTFVLDEEKASGLGSLAGLASMAGVDVEGSGGIFQGDNISELYKSRKMIVQTLLSEIVDQAGKEQLLIDRYIEFNDLRNRWQKDPKLAKLKFSAYKSENDMIAAKSDRVKDSVISGIVADITRNYLTVGKVDKKLSLTKVEVKAKDELFAKAFNEEIVAKVNDFYVQTKTKKSLQNVQIMQQKTDSVRAVINGAIYTAVAVSDATPNLNPTRQIQRVAPAQRAQFSAETNKAILSTLVQNLEMSKLSLMKETPLLEVIDQPVYPLNVEKLGKAKGIIIGTLLLSFITVIILILVKVFKSVM